MKVKRIPDNIKEVGDLDQGTCFELDGTCYMVLDTSDAVAGNTNCVCLESDSAGDTDAFLNNVKVIVREFELVEL